MILHIKYRCWIRKGMRDKKKLQVPEKLIAGPRWMQYGWWAIGTEMTEGTFFVMLST